MRGEDKRGDGMASDERKGKERRGGRWSRASCRVQYMSTDGVEMWSLNIVE